MTDSKKLAEDALRKYEYLADEVLRGDFSHVDFSPAHSGEFGGYDANSTSRTRLVTLMPLIRPDAMREDILIRLFHAETESCRFDSFGGNYPLLESLAAMLLQFHDATYYSKIFADAKNSCFDCFCGFDSRHLPAVHNGTDFLNDYSPADCINFLFYDLCMRDELAPLLDEIEEEFADDIQELGKIRYINQTLGRDAHNERYCLLHLQQVLSGSDAWEIASAFHDIIAIVIPQDAQRAFAFFERALPILRNNKDWKDCNLWFYFTVFAAQFIGAFPARREQLWAEWKPYIIPAVKRVRDPQINQILLDAAICTGDTRAIMKMKHLLRKR